MTSQTKRLMFSPGVLSLRWRPSLRIRWSNLLIVATGCLVVGLTVLLLTSWMPSSTGRVRVGSDTTPGHGAVTGSVSTSAQPFCGTPLQVFQHFQMVDADQYLV